MLFEMRCPLLDCDSDRIFEGLGGGAEIANQQPYDGFPGDVPFWTVDM